MHADRSIIDFVEQQRDLGSDCYHEIACHWLLSVTDESLFTGVQNCTCRGDEILAFVREVRDDLEEAEAP
jgi:hypothetical protein